MLVLDFGSQYTQLIARRVRELGVYSEIFPYDVTFPDIVQFNPKGIILSGGPATVTEPLTARVHNQILEMGVPVLGICYGMQTMVAQLGGEVENALVHEYGHTPLTLIETSDLTNGLNCGESNSGEAQFNVWMSHGDRVIRLPHRFRSIAQSDASPFAAVCDPQRRLYGVQFHPEVTHTEMERRFCKTFCIVSVNVKVRGSLQESSRIWLNQFVGKLEMMR